MEKKDTMDKATAFEKFKERCAAEGFLDDGFSPQGDDLQSGIKDDGTLQRFLRAREYNVDEAFSQYKATREWRDANKLIELYDSIDVADYEETRKMYTHWTGRRDRAGSPLFLFEIGQLSPAVMAAHEASCAAKPPQPSQTESESTLRLFCTYENLVRFVLPLCSAVKSRPDPSTPITGTTCIVDVTGVSLMQFWRLRTHMQAASALANAYYPETLGRTYIIGAPSYFSTVWGWINKWFSAVTVAKIFIVPKGKELSMLSEVVDPVNIPQKYGGDFPFDFGMLPELDPEIKSTMTWLDRGNEKGSQVMPMGPVRLVKQDVGEDGVRTGIAVGTDNGVQRNSAFMSLQT